MVHISSRIFLGLCFFFLFPFFGFANINLTVSPIKYEIASDPGDTIQRTAKLINLSNTSYNITTGTADFVSKGNTWAPTFIRKQIGTLWEMSTWITIDTDNFTIGPKETKDINFTIQIPENATPGGHYGAVFFKNTALGNSQGQIGVSVDYGVLILVTVSGEIIIQPEITDPIISNNSGGGWGGGNSSSKQENSTNDSSTQEKLLKLTDKCYLDLTASRYDKKCIDLWSTSIPDSEILDNIWVNTPDTPSNQALSEIDSIFENDFNVVFTLPFENQGNTHLKPTWKITLVDEDGKIIKNVWKEVIQNNFGLVIWEKIVNYLPINDVKGNVLPDTKRDFISYWKGFPYEAYDIEGKKIIKYWSPQEYYSANNISSNQVLMPWERVAERISTKTVQAQFDLTYGEDLWEPREFSSAKEFEILYKEKYIGLNPYVFIGIGACIFFIFFFWFIAAMRKKRCVNKKCRKKLKKDMNICPYCWIDQKKKKKKIKSKNKK